MNHLRQHDGDFAAWLRMREARGGHNVVVPFLGTSFPSHVMCITNPGSQFMDTNIGQRQMMADSERCGTRNTDKCQNVLLLRHLPDAATPASILDDASTQT